MLTQKKKHSFTEKIFTSPKLNYYKIVFFFSFHFHNSRWKFFCNIILLRHIIAIYILYNHSLYSNVSCNEIPFQHAIPYTRANLHELTSE